jgi:AAA domain
MLEPDRGQLKTFLDTLFKHAPKEGFVSLRSFLEGNKDKPSRITPVSLKGGLDFLLDAAEDDARRAANIPKPAVFCPPIAIFSNRQHAREQDVMLGLALSVECDKQPLEARAKLEPILGLPTLTVKSGGTWADADGQVHDKVHLHWRLAVPARGQDLAKLKRARELAALIVGGDPTNVPICHPVRWAGSWHRKGAPILSEGNPNPNVEIDLEQALKALEAAAPKTAHNKSGNGHDSAYAEGGDWHSLIENILTGESYHAAITRLAAKMSKAGMNDGASVNLLKGLMENSSGPRDARWSSRYYDIARSVSTAREKYGEPNDNPAADGAGVPIIKLSDWLRRDLPEPDFILGSWLTTTSRVFLFAPTGLGKTMVALALALAIAAGADFLHWEGRRPTRVLFVDGEMSRRLLKQRLADEVRRLGCQPEGFHILSHEDVENFAPLNSKEGQAIIEAEIARCGGIDLIVFDNVMSLIAGDQKDEEGWRHTLPWIRSLTRRGIGQFWIHHTGHDEGRSYGTKTREWQMDTVIGLEIIERPDADVSFQLNFRKARERTPSTRNDFEDVRITLINDLWGSTSATKGKGKITPLTMKFFEALRDATIGNDSSNKMYGCPTAPIPGWRAECFKRGLLDKTKGEEGNAARAMFSKQKLALIAANWIACNDTVAWIIT